jgi:hypothetical protein
MRIILLVVVFLTGCASIDNKPDSTGSEQTPDCYAHYSATPAYCSEFFHKGAHK